MSVEKGENTANWSTSVNNYNFVGFLYGDCVEFGNLSVSVFHFGLFIIGYCCVIPQVYGSFDPQNGRNSNCKDDFLIMPTPNVRAGRTDGRLLEHQFGYGVVYHP